MEMAQDCNQRKFGTRLSASIHPFRTGLFATETAFIQLGLQSTAVGPHYMRLPGTTVRNHRLRPVFMRREAHASLKNALEVFLSRTSLDLGPRVSHHTSNYPIETGQLSLLHWLMWVYLTKTARRESRWAGHQRGAWSVADNPVLRRWIAGPAG